MTKKEKNQMNLKRLTINKRLEYCSDNSIDDVYKKFNSSRIGIDEDRVEENREEFGNNVIIKEKKVPLIKQFYNAFINPFTIILIALAVVSLITDVILAEQKEWLTVIIIITMVIISGLLRFSEERKSNNAAQKLTEMVQTTTCVLREGKKQEIPIGEVVAGDIIYLAAGDIIPADVRIISCKDLFISQSQLTGESEPIEKYPNLFKTEDYPSITDRDNLAFMGSNIVSGSAMALAVAVGEDTIFGGVAKTLSEKPGKTSFEKGINSVSWVLIRFILVMVPVVLFVNGFTKGDWIEALMFAISVAVGLTPEMLPMIVTTCLAKGAVIMSRKKTIIKNLNSIQNFGAMDILCTDKTGTLTQDKVVLQRHLNVYGEESARVLKHAFLNSYYQTGLKNLMDLSIIEKTDELKKQYELLEGLAEEWEKVDEIPFDFSRRRMSVVVKSTKEKRKLITKGAVEEILSICKYVETNDGTVELTDHIKKVILETSDKLNEEGMRVIAVALKINPPRVGSFDIEDESDMILMGYLAFLDPPKESTAEAIRSLHEYGVDVKILTGDNDKVTIAICKQVGIKVSNVLLGADVANIDDKQLKIAVEKTNVFAKLSPDQKARVVRCLRENGHVVGYMGDGINDAAAMRAADVGISVDTAVDIAKESAHVILLEKDLMVLENGLIEGRKIYANMIKYIKMTAASNFGNMFSVLAASAFLPFLPMLPVHLILLNLVYDICCTSVPWDNVDKEFLLKPRKWEAKSISKFMLWFGPISSIFDITTFLVLFFVICPQAAGGAWGSANCDPVLFTAVFQAGWFIESMWTQTLVIHLIRTSHLPFIKSKASWPVTLITFGGIAIVTVIPFILGDLLKLAALPAIFFAWLALIVVAYMALTELIKRLYIKRYKQLL